MVLDAMAGDVLIALRRIIRATDIHSRSLIKSTGLTAPQLLVLQTLSRHGESTIGVLAKAVTLSQATVTTIIDRLEARELVKRIRGDEDKRKVFVVLTLKGQAAIASAPTPLQEGFVKKFAELKDWEQSLILSSLQRVAAMMGADQMDAAPYLEVGALVQQEDVSTLPIKSVR
ncbi:MAG: MarR family transcriptional regulator [Hahellaceae bacterium]|nr:MarR family transcriptional regulator [Hahellaceae bacterium]MCP5168185.1 MarR family transcriptional regulator [Hahellaceae bacterium]